MNKLFKYGLYTILMMLVVYTPFFIYQYTLHFEQLTYPLFDDGMITLEYAKNLAHHGSISVGQSGVWTAGFTSWFWMLILALLAMLPVSDYHLPFLVPLVNVVLLALSLILTSKLSPRSDRKATSAYWLLAITTPSLMFWTLRGMEVPLSMLTVSILSLTTYRLLSGKQSLSLFAFVLLLTSFLVPFIRPELSVMVVVLALYGFFFTTGGTRFVFVMSCVALGLGFLGYVKINEYLFAQPFSNSYYLKMSGVTLENRLIRGVLSVLVQLWHNLPYVLVFAGCFLAYILKRNSGETRRAGDNSNFRIALDQHAMMILVVVVLILIANWVVVGGDAWEELPLLGRFVAPCAPMVYVLIDAYLEGDTKWSRYVGFFIMCFVLLNIGYSIKTIGLGRENDKKYSIIGYELGRQFGRGVTTMHYWYGQPSYYASIKGGKSVDALGKIDITVARSKPKLKFKPGHDRWNHEYSIGKLQPDLIVNMPCPAPHDPSFNCMNVWDEITMKYGYTPHTAPMGIITVFVSPKRPELQEPVERFVLNLKKHIKERE